jgi:uncharacterized protein YcgI (DUF1989 family)
MRMNEFLFELPARSGRAVALAAGQSLQIINTHGHQVVDFWAFHAKDLSEYLSMPHTRAALSRVTPRVGDVLVDTRREPMLMFAEDSSPGVHDTLIAACDPYRYQKLGCNAPHASCADNMHTALRAHGLTSHACPASFNLWMNIPIDARGDVQWLPPVSRPGDRVTFRALMDCIAVISACPQDMLPINAGQPVSAHYRLLPAQA